MMRWPEMRLKPHTAEQSSSLLSPPPMTCGSTLSCPSTPSLPLLSPETASLTVVHLFRSPPPPLPHLSLRTIEQRCCTGPPTPPPLSGKSFCPRSQHGANALVNTHRGKRWGGERRGPPPTDAAINSRDERRHKKHVRGRESSTPFQTGSRRRGGRGDATMSVVHNGERRRRAHSVFVTWSMIFRTGESFCSPSPSFPPSTH